eukprot:650584_1
MPKRTSRGKSALDKRKKSKTKNVKRKKKAKKAKDKLSSTSRRKTKKSRQSYQGHRKKSCREDHRQSIHTEQLKKQLTQWPVVKQFRRSKRKQKQLAKANDVLKERVEDMMCRQKQKQMMCLIGNNA